MRREEKIGIMDTYKEKEVKPGKCSFKYFLNGFLSPFFPSQQKYCPHCCKKITNEDYFETFGIFTFGCVDCREVK